MTLASTTVFAATPASGLGEKSAADKVQAAAIYGQLPLSFEANQGQTGPSVKFLSHGSGYSLFLTDSGAVLALTKDNPALRPGPPLGARKKPGAPGLAFETWESKNPKPARFQPSKTDVIRMELSGASRTMRVEGADQLPGTANYFIGSDPARWRANVPTYAKVRYTGVYPGIDLVYYGNQGQLEYDFVVAAGASPKPIRLHFDGASNLSLNASGDLIVAAQNGQIAFHKPEIYQEIDGHRQTIQGSFALLANRSIGFSLGSYDRSRPLVIDPVLVYSTYLGGYSDDYASAIAVDSSGNAYIAGTADSFDFPVTNGAFQTQNNGKANGTSNAFVTKLNPAGTALVYSTYLGGSGIVYEDPSGNEYYDGDWASAIAVDGSGNAYIVGTASSIDFPVTRGAYQTQNNAQWNSASNGFVTKLNPTGTELIYSTYLGGSGYSNFDPIMFGGSVYAGDSAFGMALDSSGNTYITGQTCSVDFPVTKEAFQTKNKATAQDTYYTAGYNAFVTELNPAGSAPVYSTYIGGSIGDAGHGLALDSADNAYVIGTTASTDFPVTKGAYQSKNNAALSSDPIDLSTNAFVTKLNPAGSALVYSTYLGGSGDGYGTGLALDKTGDAFIAGYTFGTDFPVTKGVFQRTNKAAANSGANAFVTKLNPTGSALVYSTYLGGSGFSNVAKQEYGSDSSKSLAVDGSGNAYVTGQAYSADFPVTSGTLQRTNGAFANECSNAFVTKLNPAGGGLVYSTYLGGSGCGYGAGLALDGAGNTYVAGGTYAFDFPLTKGGFLTSNESIGGNNAITGFVTKLDVGATKQVGTAAMVSASANPALPGAQVKFTAEIASSIVGGAPPTGGVVFSVDGKAGQSIALSAGTATYSTSSLGLGKHSIEVSFADSTRYFGPSIGNLTETITASQAAAPIFSPAQGEYDFGQRVTLTSPTKGAVIHYTTTGEAPTASSATYAAAIKLTETTTIKAIAVAPGDANSIVSSATYTIRPLTPRPTFSPAAGTVASGQIVKIADTATTGLVIYYTTNGDAPTTLSTKYTSAGIKVTATETIQAIAIASGDSPSPVGSAKYTVE